MEKLLSRWSKDDNDKGALKPLPVTSEMTSRVAVATLVRIVKYLIKIHKNSYRSGDIPQKLIVILLFLRIVYL